MTKDKIYVFSISTQVHVYLITEHKVCYSEINLNLFRSTCIFAEMIDALNKMKYVVSDLSGIREMATSQ